MSIVPPKNEIQRLQVLWQYEVLDTVPETVFDDLTELAARICESPIALISLVDEKRQWFKSKFGTSLKETSRDISFCTHAIQSKGLFIVPDATKDPRFARNPLVTGAPRIRFYAGAPLIAPGGHALGSFCVIDKVPRTLRADQKQALLVLARHVVSQLELRRQARELAATRKTGNAAETSLKKARTEIVRLKRSLAAAKSKAKRSLH